MIGCGKLRHRFVTSRARRTFSIAKHRRNLTPTRSTSIIAVLPTSAKFDRRQSHQNDDDGLARGPARFRRGMKGRSRARATVSLSASVFFSTTTIGLSIFSARKTTAFTRAFHVSGAYSLHGISLTKRRLMSSNGCTDVRRILWQGPLFGRLSKRGKQHLTKHKGWTELLQPPDENHQEVAAAPRRLALIWPNKSGPQFEIDDAKAAHIRPYPKHITDVLDDKVLLGELLQHTELMPKHICSPDDANPDKMYFVKHRFGAQGKGVYCMHHDELQEWWERTNNPNDFVIQEEVLPELYEGRKFVMRSHILLWHSTFAKASEENAPYNAQSSRASQISNVGKNHPTPVLLKDLPSDHPARDILPQLAKHSESVVALFDRWFRENTGSQQRRDDRDAAIMAPETVCFALLGLDWLLEALGKNDDDGRQSQIKLCEINSHPALGWGTMSKVPPRVFVDLVEQTLELLTDVGEE